jgi:hypothetical protein
VSYRVAWTGPVLRAVPTWNLPDQVFVEMRLRVNALSRNPSSLLVRTREPIDGMTLPFEMIDPTNRLCVHVFLFHIVYSQDEETLYVARGTHFRRIG